MQRQSNSQLNIYILHVEQIIEKSFDSRIPPSRTRSAKAGFDLPRFVAATFSTDLRQRRIDWNDVVHLYTKIVCIVMRRVSSPFSIHMECVIPAHMPRAVPKPAIARNTQSNLGLLK